MLDSIYSQLISEDGLTYIKIVGVLLTGSFGIIGAATEFRKDNKVTRWGRRNLIALVVCVAITVIFEFGSAVVNKHKAEDAAERERASARHMAQLLKQTNSIFRSLYNTGVNFTYSVSLRHPLLKTLIARLQLIEPVDQKTGERAFLLESLDFSQDWTGGNFITSGATLWISIRSAGTPRAKASLRIDDFFRQGDDEHQLNYLPNSQTLRVQSQTTNVKLQETQTSGEPFGVRQTLPGARVEFEIRKLQPMVAPLTAASVVADGGYDAVSLDEVWLTFTEGFTLEFNLHDMKGCTERRENQHHYYSWYIAWQLGSPATAG